MRVRWGMSLVPMLMMTGLVSCATDQHESASFGKRVLVGKSDADVIACAGQPTRRVTQGTRVELVYRNEPSALERSLPMGKGSMAGPYHGCEASVMVREGRVTDVEYHPFPESSGAGDHCDRIFTTCGAQ